MVAAPAARAGKGAPVRALIVGGGPAGDAVAAGLRDAGFDGEIVLVGTESEPPYERPHLSKGYLLGTVPREKLRLRPAEQYRELGVQLRLGEQVEDLGLERSTAELESGEKISWDLLCIATGSSARRLASFENALYLRELADADVLRAVLERGELLNVIGAGFIGCEVAAAARLRGCAVRVYEALAQPLLRVLGPELGAYVADVHRAHGVEMHLEVEQLPDLGEPVVAGVGSIPRTALAERAGLAIEGGVVVDAFGRTDAPGVFAAGDVTRFWSPLYEARIRVEHFQTAQRQGFAVGRAMAGATEPYSEVPWFWSDQFDLKLKMAGLLRPGLTTVLRGDPATGRFALFHLDHGLVVAVEASNAGGEFIAGKQFIHKRSHVDPTALADIDVSLRKVVV